MEKRRRSQAETRARIVAAARAAFGRQGYPVVGVRGIAAIAGVNSALIFRYFGSKLELFEAALVDSLADPPRPDQKAGYGELLVTAIADLAVETDLPMMVALALGDPAARRVAERVVRERVIAPMAGWLGGAEAAARAEALFMVGTGFTLVSRQIGATTSPDLRAAVARQVSELVQSLADRGLGGAREGIRTERHLACGARLGG